MSQISDWDDAYNNRKHVPNVDEIVSKWQSQAANFRLQMQKDGRVEIDVAYGKGRREKFDIFMPTCKPKGLAVFVHGGYWLRFDKSCWSHLAKGALDNGYAVAIPSYDLAPDVSVSEITIQIARAIETAANFVRGDIYLAGHSAGGQLVCRMICQNSPLAIDVQSRIKKVTTISGVHDLRPLLKTELNQVLKLDRKQTADESPALLCPIIGAKLTCIVGTSERKEFIRQSELIANIWTGLGADTIIEYHEAKNHFTVIEELELSNSQITTAFVENI